MVFTFGKYAGYPLKDIPASYLAKAVEEYSMPEALVCQCRIELSRRFGLSDFSPPTITAESLDLRMLIRQTYRELARIYHPDMGGSTEAMQALNDYHRALTQ